jgi:hypothetical protein
VIAPSQIISGTLGAVKDLAFDTLPTTTAVQIRADSYSFGVIIARFEAHVIGFYAAWKLASATRDQAAGGQEAES